MGLAQHGASLLLSAQLTRSTCEAGTGPRDRRGLLCRGRAVADASREEAVAASSRSRSTNREQLCSGSAAFSAGHPTPTARIVVKVRVTSRRSKAATPVRARSIAARRCTRRRRRYRLLRLQVQQVRPAGLIQHIAHYAEAEEHDGGEVLGRLELAYDLRLALHAKELLLNLLDLA